MYNVWSCVSTQSNQSPSVSERLSIEDNAIKKEDVSPLFPEASHAPLSGTQPIAISFDWLYSL